MWPGPTRERGSETRATALVGVHGFEAVALEDRWILSRFNRVAQEMNEAIQAYRFDNACHTIYQFFWGEFCDWYLELIKPRLNSEDKPTVARACANLVALFEAALRLLHPIMPFITEEIWHALYEQKPPLKSIALAPYPQADAAQMDDAAETEMAILQDLIVSVRNLRAELKVEPRQNVPIQVHTEDGVRQIFEENRGAVERLANVAEMEFVGQSLAKEAGARSTARFDVRVVYEKKIDVAAERERLAKELARIEKQIESAERQLGNEQFLAKAPPKVVEGLRKQLTESKLLREKTHGGVEGAGISFEFRGLTCASCRSGITRNRLKTGQTRRLTMDWHSRRITAVAGKRAAGRQSHQRRDHLCLHRAEAAGDRHHHDQAGLRAGRAGRDPAHLRRVRTARRHGRRLSRRAQPPGSFRRRAAARRATSWP